MDGCLTTDLKRAKKSDGFSSICMKHLRTELECSSTVHCQTVKSVVSEYHGHQLQPAPETSLAAEY